MVDEKQTQALPEILNKIDLKTDNVNRKIHGINLK
jgi:hypothetical protein